MADVTVKRLDEFEAIFGGGFRRVRAGLGVTSFGIAVMDIPPNFKMYPEHDQSHDGQEEVYTALSGRATMVVGGEEIELEPDVWIRVGPDEKRKIVSGDEPVKVLAHRRDPGRGLRAAGVHRRGRGSSHKFAREREAPLEARPSGRGLRPRGRCCALAPGPSSAVTRWSRPEITAPGTPESLSRTRSAALAAWSATEIAVAASSRPWPSRRPRQSSIAAIPAQPMATSAWPSFHGRPKLSAITTAGAVPPAPRISARMRRAEASASTGQQRHQLVAAGQVRGVDARRWRRSSRRSSRRSAPRAPRAGSTATPPSTSSTRAGSLPVFSASSSARSQGSTSASRRTRPSAFETTFCETTTISPSAGSAASAISAPEVVSLADLGQAR